MFFNFELRLGEDEHEHVGTKGVSKIRRDKMEERELGGKECAV